MGAASSPARAIRDLARANHYVGYPMAYWVQFKPEYGFHAGPVWPIPHSHGCIRLHPNAAPKFFALVHQGTPVDIDQSQPEDQTIGKEVLQVWRFDLISWADAPRPIDFRTVQVAPV